MKEFSKCFLLCALFMCSVTMWGETLTHSVSFPTTARHTQVVTLDDGRQYLDLKYDNTESTNTPGAPTLPVKYVRLSVPYNACNFSVSCSYRSRTSARATKKIIPCEQPVTTNEVFIDSLHIVEDSTIYNSNSLYPASLGEVVSDGYFMGSNHVITIAVYPSQYNPVSGQLYFYGSVTVTVSYEIDDLYQNTLVRIDPQLQTEEQQLLASMVENSYQVAAFAAPATNIPIGRSLNDAIGTPGQTTDSIGVIENDQRAVESYEYTVITTHELKPAFKRLIALKRQKGLDAGVVCIEDIMANPIVNIGDVMYDKQGNYVSTIADSAGVVREYLKYAFAYGTKYVLIGGQGMPFRYGYRNSTDIGGDTIKRNVPTDWYYCELNTNWNLNGNNFYGERNDITDFDYHPELFVGRLLATNSTDIENYTDKLICYELNPGKGDPTYLKRTLVVEGAEDFDTQHCAAIHYDLLGFRVDTVNQIVRQTDYLNCYPTGPQVINMLKNYGILSIHGHGSPHTTSVNCYVKGSGKSSYNSVQQRICALDSCDSNYERRPVEGNGLDLMDNKYCPSIFYSWSCTTTPFDVYKEPSENYIYNGWNMGQSYTLGKDYGGIAYLGNTRVGTTKDYKKEICFINRILKEKHIGAVEALSKDDFGGVYFSMAHNLIGDPEVCVWTDIPEYMNNVTEVRFDNYIEIQHPTNDSITVGICGADSVFKQVLYGSNIRLYNINPNSSIMIYRDNNIPYIAPLLLQNHNINTSQYIIARDVIAGRAIDANRSEGNVTVNHGVTYELELNGELTLAPGFNVEKGASFEAKRPKYNYY